MERGESGVVAGLFATRRQTMSVQKDLRRIGLTDQDIDVGVPVSGRYSLDIRESEGLGSGIIDGIVIGTLVGAVIGVLLLVIAVPHVMEMGMSAIALGILIGGFWGSFFGGLGGMVITASGDASAAKWCEIPERSAVLLVVARAGAHADEARKVMRRCGAPTLLRQTPSMMPSSTMAPLGLPVPDSAADVTQPDDGTRTIEIPRGAFLLLIAFLIAVSVLWANVYLRVVWRV